MTNVKENVAKAAINNDTKPASTPQLVDGENIYDLPEEMEMDEKVPPQRYSVDYSTDFPTLGANTCQESEQCTTKPTNNQGQFQGKHFVQASNMEATSHDDKKQDGDTTQPIKETSKAEELSKPSINSQTETKPGGSKATMTTLNSNGAMSSSHE